MRQIIFSWAIKTQFRYKGNLELGIRYFKQQELMLNHKDSNNNNLNWKYSISLIECEFKLLYQCSLLKNTCVA